MGLDVLNEGAVHAAVEAQALAQLGGPLGRGAEIDVDVGGAGQPAVGDAGKIPLADVLDEGHVALDRRDLLLHAVDDLVDGLLLAPVVEDEGGAVVAFGRFHGRSLRLSWFIAWSGPPFSSSSRS